LYFENLESEFSFSSTSLIEVVVYSELHRTSGVIVRRNIVISLRVPTAYSAALVCSALIAASPWARALLEKKKVRNSREESESEYRIGDGRCSGVGIPNILDEYRFYTEIRIPDISATISRVGRTTKTAP
jgi:hypothetical protein